MQIVLAIVFGIVWGAAAAFINSLIAKKALEKQDMKAAKNARRVQMLVDIAALGLLVLLREILPFSFEYALISAIISLSVLTTVFLFSMGKTK